MVFVFPSTTFPSGQHPLENVPVTGQAPALQERAKFYLFLRFFDREHGLANVRGLVLVFPSWT